MNSMYSLMSRLSELSEDKKSTDNDFTKKPDALEKGTTTTHKGGSKTVGDTGTKHKGKYGTEYQGDDEEYDDDGKKKKAPKKPDGEKRGRGRPTKPENQAEKDKPDWSAFGVKKDVKLKPWDKAKTTKHSLKDWIENLDKALNEDGPLKVTTTNSVQDAKGNTVATGNDTGALAKIASGDVTLPGANDHTVDEASQNHMGENEIHSYFAWRVACRKAGGKTFDGDRDICQALDSTGNGVGEWDGVCGTVYGNAHTTNPAQDPHDIDDPAPMESRMVRESSTVNGKTENPKSLKWKQTSVTPAAATAKYGKANVKVTKGGLNNGKDMVEVKVPLGEARLAEKDLGKHNNGTTTGFKAVANKAAKEYGSKAAGERVAGAVKAKMAKAGQLEESAECSMKELCDLADHYDSKAYADLCERDISDAAFKTALQRIVASHEKKKKPVSEGKVKELQMDLGNGKDSLPDAEFKKKYGKSKADMRKSVNDKKPVKESILRESYDTMQHIIDTHKHEVKKFIEGGDLDEHLYDALYDYYCNQGEMPYGTMKARSGDPYEWVTQRFDRDVNDYNVPAGRGDLGEGEFTQHYFDANKPSSVRQRAEADSAPRVQTPWSEDPIAAATDRIYDKVSPDPWAIPDKHDVQFESWTKELDTLLNEGINITVNSGLGDGPDSATVSATEEDAQELIDIVKSAGLGMFSGSEDAPAGDDKLGFSGDAIDSRRDGEEIDVSASEPEVVDDQDGMMELIKRMAGQSDSEASDGEEEVDETRDTNYGDQDAAWDRQKGPKSSDDDYEYEQDKQKKLDDEEDDPQFEDEDDHYNQRQRRTDEGYANDADKTFVADIEFMTKGLSGGLNNQKKSQSVGNPVTIASTPLKETTDLLRDYRKLAGN